MDKYNKYEWIPISYKEAVDKISTNNKKIKQKEYISNGKYPVIDQGQEFIGGFTNDESKLLNCTLPALVFGDHTKIVKLVNYKFAPGADGVKVVVPRKFFNAKLFEFFTKILALKIPDKGYARHFQYIEKSKIPLPPLLEQRAIVSKVEQLFSDLDNGIDNFKKAQEQLKIYRQAVLKKAFEGELTRKWREEQTDLPSFEELLQQVKEELEKHYQKQLDKWKKAVKDWEDNGNEGKKPPRSKKPKELPPLTEEELVELPELPEGWCWMRLGIIANKIQIGPFGSQLHKDDYRKEGVPIINPKHIKDQNLNPKERISKNKADSLSQYYLQENDIILGRRGEMGRSAPITSKSNAWLCGTGSLYIRLGQQFKSTLYSLILSEKRVVNYLENQSRGTTMANLNSQILNFLPIQLIPIAEQSQIVREIETRLSVCDKMETTIAESLQKAESLRQSILKKAFEGKLLNEKELEEARNAPDWEPAEKLLERIRQEKQIKENNNKPTRRKTHG